MSGPDWQPTAAPAVLRERAAMLARIRAWFLVAGLTEVQTPLLSRAAVSDPALESVRAELHDGLPRWLHTSPEYAMKRLLAAGAGDCWQICPVFRAGESGRLHNPEFTLIEWYRIGADVPGLILEVERLLREALTGLRELAPARCLSYREALLEFSGLDWRGAGADAIAGVLAAHGVQPAASAADWEIDDWLDLLMGTVVGPRLGYDAPTFVRDYPASQAALARLRDDGDGWPVGERFELYLDGIELANGFHELCDADEQRRRFERDQRQRARRGAPLRPLDEHLLAALRHGLPDCAGVALGFDRLVMVALRLRSLADALPFPIDRA